MGDCSSHDNDPTLKNCLFDAVTLTKNAGVNIYHYSGYEVRFDRRSAFSFRGSGFGQNLIIFGVDILLHTLMIRKKTFLILAKGLTQGLVILLWQKRKSI